MIRSLRNIILVILVLAALLWLLRRTDVIPDWKNPFAAQPITIDNTPLLVKNVRAISQLMTIEYLDEVVVDSSRQTAKMLPLPPFIFPVRSSLVLIVKGRLIAGLDMQQLDSSHFSGNRDSINIRLPRAKVLDVIVNPTDVETFSEEGDWTPQAFSVLKVKARNQILRNALNQGVLQRSDEKARYLVQQLMENAGYKKVVITAQ